MIGLALWVMIGMAAGRVVSGFFKNLSQRDWVLVGLTSGVMGAFLQDVATTGAWLLQSSTFGSMVMALFGAILFVLLRRLISQGNS